MKDMRIGDLPFNVRFASGKTGEKVFANKLISKNVSFRFEKVNQQYEPDYIKRHTPDFYLPDHRAFVEVKTTHNLRVDLIDAYMKWYNTYVISGEYMFYIAVLSKDMDYVELYDLKQLYASKDTFEIGKWNDGQEYYKIPQGFKNITWRL